MIAVVLAACSPKAGQADAAVKTPETARTVSVEVLKIAAQAPSSQLRASGMVAFKNETTLGFNAPGQIEAINVEQGDRVKAGDVLATLRRTSVGADATEADLARQTAQQVFDRTSRLFAAGAASQADLDTARLALERSREIVSITAPASGIILKRDAIRGQVVTAGQLVFQLGELGSGVVVRASISSADVARLKVGDPVAIAVRGRPDRSGKITQLSPKMAAGMGAFEIEARFDDGTGLLSGEVAEVRIDTGVAPAVSAAPLLYVPALSLIDARADQAMVFVVDAQNVARRKSVRTEGVTDKGVAVAEGLAEGDLVITRGASMVRDGDRVSIAKGE